uniref:Uncharacterized protein AlNc14C279G10092 n=1 Tax=Albugo laibachii Nc14 TaxID=890382 RepID=F0WUU4_9STRA|nr:conserved hypothetical protein [Albugo laibachii Nc14]|eukprot:CCA25180.1 conserved hypothetical protein [Albugo laibachii Nc14]
MARNSLGGPGRLQKMSARIAFIARHKLAVVASFDELGDISAVIRKFYPNLACSRFDGRRKLKYQWIRDREALKRVCASPVQAENKKARSLGVATILSAEDERVSVTWINELRGFGVPTTTTMVQLKAREVARASETASFTASNTWLKLFKNRHKFSMRARTRKGQSTPTEADQVAVDFGKKVRQMASDLGVSKIYNADQTDVSCFFEYIPARTLTKKEEKTVSVRCGGKDKKLVTVMLLADSAVAEENRVQRLWSPAVEANAKDPGAHENARVGKQDSVVELQPAAQVSQDVFQLAC